MALATWWHGDYLPPLPKIMNFHASLSDDAALLAQMAHLSVEEVQTRLLQAHRPYIAWLDDVPVAYGWVATQTAHVGELDLTITLPVRTRYLWDFATLPAWRGRGIYPRLLQAILTAEADDKEQFWIIAAPENHASSAGIAKAGFRSVAHLSFQREGQPRLIPIEDESRVSAAEALLRVPQLEANAVVTPCWCCAIDANKTGKTLTDISCWTELTSEDLTLGTCDCGKR